MSKLDRRLFLSASAGSVCSLIVRVEGARSPKSFPATRQQRLEALRQLAPDSSLSMGSIPEAHMTLVDLECDFLVAGGGISGVCAAISAARHGAKVILVQDRPRLGGNSSSEIKMHIVGANRHADRPGWREGGLIEEFRLEDAVWNPHRAWELWDLMLYDKCVSEPNLTLLLDSVLYSAEVENGQIRRVLVRCDKTEHIYRITSRLYCDATGDSRLSLEAGAELRMGRESRTEFNESLAPETADERTQGSSILFTSRKYDQPCPFRAPSWARRITREHLKFRPANSWEYGYWWIELGGADHTIRDNERLRFELLSVVLGVWHYIKNSGNHPESANWALQTVGMIPGKRESRRVMGEVIQTQSMLDGGWRNMTDGVSIGGWNFDDHPPEGFDAPDKPPFTTVPIREPYNISLGALYSRNIRNLMMAGRNISNTHVAFTSTRVMATCAGIGQAVGTAASQCLKAGIIPKELRSNRNRVEELQQVLLRDDQTIRGIRNQDRNDLARTASVSASGSVPGGDPANVLTGKTRDVGKGNMNKWVAKMPVGTGRADPPFIELRWAQPVRISVIQITFDTGFHRELTLSASDSVTSRMIRGAQPETVRDYSLSVETADGRRVELAETKGNYQRLRRHDLDPIEAASIRLTVLSTNGSDTARVFEIRCY